VCVSVSIHLYKPIIPIIPIIPIYTYNRDHVLPIMPITEKNIHSLIGLHAPNRDQNIYIYIYTYRTMETKQKKRAHQLPLMVKQ
jgi:hypothetical protein